MRICYQIFLILFLFIAAASASVQREKPPPPPPAAKPPSSPAPKPIPKAAPALSPTEEYTDIFSKLTEINDHSGKFNKLLAVLRDTGKDALLKSNGAFTLFAPDDDAFAKLPAEDFDRLSKDKQRLGSVISRHIIKGGVMPVKESRITSIVERYPQHFSFNLTAIKQIKSTRTLNGETVVVIINGETVTVDSARITKKDYLCRNGVIHLVDSVLLTK